MDKKQQLREYFLKAYKTKGYEWAKGKAVAMLKQSGKDAQGDFSKLSEFRGNLAEIILELVLQEYMKRNNYSFYVANLCIKKKKSYGVSDYTELDVTLFTPHKIILFECKCYAGQKTLTDKCTIQREGKADMDVFGQSLAHLDVLKHYTDPYRDKRDPNKKGYQLCFFEVSLDETVDNRSAENKQIVPYLTLDNIDSWLDSQSNQPKVWDFKSVYKIIEKLNKDSKDNLTKHLEMLRRGKK